MKQMTYEQAREALTGPIGSIRPAFNSDGSIDYDGTANIVERHIEAGNGTILLTAGDSHYFCLTEQEITDLTRFVVQQTKGRAMVCAADLFYDTQHAGEFAKICADLGADMLMVLPPDWGGSTTVQSLAEHYEFVSRQIPVMLVTNIFIPRGEAFGLEAIEKTLDMAPNVVAIKDDMCGLFARKMCARFSDRVAIIAGGQKQNHLDIHPYGCHGYLSAFSTFRPDIAQRYWQALEGNDIDAASRIVKDIDMPMFDVLLESPGGFDAAIHGMLELFGLAQRHRRRPYHTLTDEEMARLAEQLRTLQLLV